MVSGVHEEKSLFDNKTQLFINLYQIKSKPYPDNVIKMYEARSRAITYE